MPHPDEGLIHAWLDGELDAAEAARVEALVASDAEWAAAAAEARGLIAASARIVGTLDRVPGSVIPKMPVARPMSRRWAWRAAAALALMAGSAVVLERETPVLRAPEHADSVVGAVPVPNARQQAPLQLPQKQSRQQSPPTPDAKVAVAKKNPEHKSELADVKPAEPARDKDAVNPPGELQGRATGASIAGASANAAGAERRAVNVPASAATQVDARSAPAPQPAAPAIPNFEGQRLTRLPPSCFAQRVPADTAARIIRLSAGALEDSIRLETLVLRGDTLAAVHGRFTAIRVPCPEP